MQNFKNHLEKLKKEIQRETSKLKFKKNPEYYKRKGLNEFLEPEEEGELLLVVSKGFQLSSHSRLSIEEIKDYEDTTSKLLKLKGTSFYLEEFIKEGTKFSFEVPVKLYKKLNSLYGDKVKLVKHKDTLTVSGDCPETRQGIVELAFEYLNPFN